MYLYEIQASAIDQQLEQTANSVKQSGDAINPNGAGGMMSDGTIDDSMEGGMGAELDPSNPDPMMDMEDEVEEIKAKDVDSAILAAVNGMNYLDEYRHDDASKTHPMRILQMELEELSELRRLVKAKITSDTIQDKPGMYDDPGMKFYQDLISFTDRILDTMKQATKDADDKHSKEKSTKFKTKEPSKNNNRKEIKQKRNDK